MMTEKKFHCSL